METFLCGRGDDCSHLPIFAALPCVSHKTCSADGPPLLVILPNTRWARRDALRHYLPRTHCLPGLLPRTRLCFPGPHHICSCMLCLPPPARDDQRGTHFVAGLCSYLTLHAGNYLPASASNPVYCYLWNCTPSVNHWFPTCPFSPLHLLVHTPFLPRTHVLL